MADSWDMIPNYATLDDAKTQLPATLLEDVDDTTLGRLVSHASRTIGKATRHATYDTDDDHLPRSETLRNVFREATVAQVRSWIEANLVEELFTGGATTEARVSSSGINGKSVSFDHSQSDAARAHLIGGGLGAEASLILDQVGLLGGLPGVYR